ncbi:hypothetical protein NQ317_012920 [Molorchus minor]|uniref:Uncharacterized protein n=1 Tax=Molorchus minor TaxID=1323400 RepID=A0ABQ9JAI1_9CUCU|nr:hypothetical protein NQ317_012920 [Molorchus minor]
MLPQKKTWLINQEANHTICSSEGAILSTPYCTRENIILTNDGKSHVSANIRVNVDGDVYINCVNIYDQVSDGKGGYPSFSAGGVGRNFVEFNVMTDYGKGFHFFIQIYGHVKRDKNKKK